MNLWFLLFSLPILSSAFAPSRYLDRNFARNGFHTVLKMAYVSVTNPSPENAADMGIRDWPQQLKEGNWNEEAKDGQTLVRYILDGTGVLNTEASDLGTKSYKLTPGTLVEITGQTSLNWKANDQLIVLTPGFEEGGKFIGVLVIVLLTFGALLGSTL